MPEYRARPHRFRVICGESRTVTEISANDAATMQEWIYTIRMVMQATPTYVPIQPTYDYSNYCALAEGTNLFTVSMPQYMYC